MCLCLEVMPGPAGSCSSRHLPAEQAGGVRLWNAQYSRNPLLVAGGHLEGAGRASEEPIAFAVPCGGRRAGSACGGARESEQALGILEPSTLSVAPCPETRAFYVDDGCAGTVDEGLEEENKDVLSRTNGVEVFAREHDAACECLERTPGGGSSLVHLCGCQESGLCDSLPDSG